MEPKVLELLATKSDSERLKAIAYSIACLCTGATAYETPDFFLAPNSRAWEKQIEENDQEEDDDDDDDDGDDDEDEDYDDDDDEEEEEQEFTASETREHKQQQQQQQKQ